MAKRGREIDVEKRLLQLENYKRRLVKVRAGIQNVITSLEKAGSGSEGPYATLLKSDAINFDALLGQAENLRLLTPEEHKKLQATK